MPMDRFVAGSVLSVGYDEILHLNGISNTRCEGREDAGARRLQVDRAERVEVPIVVVPMGAVWMAAAWRPLRCQHLWLKIDGVINAGPRGKQVGDRCLPFLWGQRGSLGVDAESRKRISQANAALLDCHSDERAEQALAHGGDLGLACGVAPFGDHASALHDHHCARADVLRISLSL